MILTQAAEAAKDLRVFYQSRGLSPSAHHRLEEKRLQNEAHKLLRRLAKSWVQDFPDHWDKTYSFYLNTDGKELRFSLNHGKSPKGIKVEATLDGLRFLHGFITGLIDAPVIKKDVRRQQALHTQSFEPYLFLHRALRGYRSIYGIYTQIGTRPTDSFAQLTLAGTFPEKKKLNVPKLDNPFEGGARHARDWLMKEGREWSGSLVVWNRLKEKDGFKKLRANMPKESDILKTERFFMIEDRLAKVEAALDHLSPCTRKSTWIVLDKKEGIEVSAWDASSALLARYLKEMTGPNQATGSPQCWRASRLDVQDTDFACHL